MMESTQLAKQTLGFQKTIFDNSFNAVAMAQDQGEKMINNYMEAIPWVTKESRDSFRKSIDIAKQARNDFKKAVEDGFAKFEELLEEK